ncbi:MAG: type II toxin-antitoxin system VapC family toxin [Thermoanaerobaculia bacterium]|nr:type II toxin-antitoxin system VapC family toxin [Thermoanaerobaculia bacterium]
MGSLTLPTGGPVYLDANGFIYSVERIEPYASLLQPLWQAAQNRELEIISSELVILETLVKPLREKDETLVSIFRALLFEAREVRLIPTTTAIWETAAHLRATLGLKTPDAVHVATAIAVRSTTFITNDPHFRRASELSVIVLKELLEDESQ